MRTHVVDMARSKANSSNCAAQYRERRSGKRFAGITSRPHLFVVGSIGWCHLISHYKQQILATDLFTVEIIELKTLYVLFFIELDTRCITSQVSHLIQLERGPLSRPDSWFGNLMIRNLSLTSWSIRMTPSSQTS